MDYIKAASIHDFKSKDFKCFRYLGRTIVILKKNKDSFYAMEADCKHQKANLFTGKRQGDLVTCPRHSWQYNIKTGECLTEKWAGLGFYPIEVRQSDIYIYPK